ncbi:hypothetical protein LTR28_009056 [Elasticomyces elasticus]|nr:hypothetical protein LTR28_009056 [Elasticomyces elasticus]
MHAFILNPDSPFFDSTPGFGLMVYDANGKEHGRSEQGFKWALDIEGAVDMTREMNLFEVNQLTAASGASMGKVNTWMTGALVSDIDSDFLVRASKWFTRVLRTDKALAAGSFVLIEMMQQVNHPRTSLHYRSTDTLTCRTLSTLRARMTLPGRMRQCLVVMCFGLVQDTYLELNVPTQ